MNLLRFATLEEACAELAARVAASLREALALRACASLAVPGGRTPMPLFHALRRMALDWSRVRITLTDERWVPETHPASNAAMVRRELLVDQAGAATFVPLFNGASGPAQGSAPASRAVRELLPLDSVVLGMGGDGHFASLFPDSPGVTEALSACDAPACVAMQAPVDPVDRLSLNLAAFAASRDLNLLVSGQDKLAVLRGAQVRAEPRLPVAALLDLTPPPAIFWAP